MGDTNFGNIPDDIADNVYELVNGISLSGLDEEKLATL